MAKEDPAEKMRRYRDRLRAQGPRPVQVWVPDSRAPGFQRSLEHQIANLDPADEAGALAFIDDETLVRLNRTFAFTIGLG